MRLRYLHIPDLPPLKDVSITFGHEPVLGRQCTIHFIVGVNGTGKSRLLRAIVEIFLALQQTDLPPFPVTIAYDLGRNLPGQESSQAVSTIYYRYGGYGRSSAYMVILDHILLHTNVDWEQFHKLPWESESAKLPYRKRRYLQRDNLSEATSYLPTTLLAYTSGSPQEWERTFSPPPPGIEERLDIQFPRVKQDPQERRQDERPPYWSSAAEVRYRQQTEDNDSSPLRSSGVSDGERMFLGRMALFHLLRGIDDTLIVLDEPETHFNDIWKREVVDIIDNSLRDDASEIIISTHSSIALTDVFNTEITQLKKHREEAGVYAARPLVHSFGSSPDDILRNLFGASVSIGQRASEFLSLVLMATTQWGNVQAVLAMESTDEQIKTSKEFEQLRRAAQEELDAYKPTTHDMDTVQQGNFELDDYILQTLRAIHAYTRQHRSEVNQITVLDVLQERLGPGYYQFEFRRRLRALRKGANAT